MKKIALIGAVACLAAASCSLMPRFADAQPAPAAAAAAPTPVAVRAPSGVYRLDKTHATLTFQVMHLGLSQYTARFTDFDATLTFDAANPAASGVAVTVNPASVETDYPGDYRATHANSTYASWDEDLARNPRWFNAGAFPQIRFVSTGITLTGPRTGQMTGDLTFLGVTRPVTLDVTFNGELTPHPFLNGRAALGFSARGAIKRSDFGMTALIPAGERPGIGDEVSLIIEAEFHQAPPAG